MFPAGFFLALPFLLRGQQDTIRLSIAPLRAEYRLVPGALQTDATRISNDGDLPMHIRASINDWKLTLEGSPDFLAPGAPPPDEFSCAAWITLNPGEFDLSANRVQLIRYTIQVPADAKPGGYRSAIVLTTVPRAIQLEPKEKAIQTRVRLVTIIYVKVGEPEVRGRLAGLELTPSESGPGADLKKPLWEIRASVENEGTMYFRVIGEVKLLDSSGAEVDVFKIGNEVVLPRSTRSFLFKHPDDLTPGAYRLLSTLDIGKPALIQSERQVTIQAPAPSGEDPSNKH